MIHFRGLQVSHVRNEHNYTGAVAREYEWAPLCSTRALPTLGDVTTELHKVTCNDCRKILRLPKLKFEDDSERRFP